MANPFREVNPYAPPEEPIRAELVESKPAKKKPTPVEIGKDFVRTLVVWVFITAVFTMMYPPAIILMGAVGAAIVLLAVYKLAS